MENLPETWRRSTRQVCYKVSLAIHIARPLGGDIVLQRMQFPLMNKEMIQFTPPLVYQ